MLTSIALTVSLFAAAPGAPAAPASPTETVQSGNDQVQKLLADKATTVQTLAERADEFVDFVELAKRALGREWAKLTPKQREEFSTTMKQLLRASYAQKAIGRGESKTKYGKEKIDGNEAEVATTLVVGKDQIPVVYRLYRIDADSPWRIFDVVTDEVSLVETYRDQFRKLIAQKGYDGLLSTLKQKRDQLEKRMAQSAESKP